MHSLLKRGTLLSCLFTAALSLPGCKGLKTGAVEEFGRMWSCPEDRVVATRRPELRFGDLVLSGATAPTPPVEVQRDPGRLAKWQADQRDKVADLAESLNDLEVYELQGCGHRTFLGCGHPRSSDGDGVIMSATTCQVLPDSAVPPEIRGTASPGTK